MPGDIEARHDGLGELGASLHRALRRGSVARVSVPDEHLDQYLSASGAARARAHRLTRPHLPGLQRFSETEYLGVCVQGSRQAQPGDALGVLAPSWVFERALVVGRQRNGRRVASWVEGFFLFTDRGFVAIDLDRVESPRWEHSDLEIGACDMQVGL